MDRLSLPLAVVLAIEPTTVVTAAAGRMDPPAAEAGASSAGQTPCSADCQDWQGYPNKALREAIHCPKKTWKRVAANTYLELFAQRWHDQPEPASESDLRKVRVAKDVAAIFPMRKYRSVPESGYAETFAMIDADGSVVEAYVTCSTDPDFHAPSMAAVRKSTYEPAAIAGRPIASVIRRPYLFLPGGR